MFTVLSTVGKRGAVCECSVCRKPYTVNDRFSSQKVMAGDQCPTCKHLPNNEPTQDLLHQIYNYDPITGKLSYKRDFNRRKQGDDPTSLTNNGYLVVTLDKTYLAHRIIWLMQTGEFPEFVDHENHDRTDNTWDNLVDVSRQRNAQNKSVNVNNTSGFLGVSYMPSKGKYRAYITRDSKAIHLGLFNTAEEANKARAAANEAYGFHENHGK